jgi:hypothetical protein
MGTGNGKSIRDCAGALIGAITKAKIRVEELNAAREEFFACTRDLHKAKKDRELCPYVCEVLEAAAKAREGLEVEVKSLDLLITDLVYEYFEYGCSCPLYNEQVLDELNELREQHSKKGKGGGTTSTKKLDP